MNSTTAIFIAILAILGLGWFWMRGTHNRRQVYGQAGGSAHPNEPQSVGAAEAADSQPKPQHKHGGCC